MSQEQPCGIRLRYLTDVFTDRIGAGDRPYHCFLLRGIDKEEPDEYEFNRVVFGVNASPFVAQFVSQEHAPRYKSQYPLASETVLKSETTEQVVG